MDRSLAEWFSKWFKNKFSINIRDRKSIVNFFREVLMFKKLAISILILLSGCVAFSKAVVLDGKVAMPFDSYNKKDK